MKELVIALMFSVLVTPWALAHEGHVHKVMGTVSTIHENHLEVKGTDGKVAVITLTDKTKILRGKAPAKPADIKSGERIVVIATQTKDKDGKQMLVAKEVRLGATADGARR